MDSSDRTKKAVEPAAEEVVVYEGSVAYTVVAMMGGRCVKEEEQLIGAWRGRVSSDEQLMKHAGGFGRETHAV